MKEVTDDIFNSVAEDILQTDVLRNDIITDAKKKCFYNRAITFTVYMWPDDTKPFHEDVLLSTASRYIKLVCDAFVRNGEIVTSDVKTETWYSRTKYYFDVYYYYTGNPFYGIRQLINFLASFVQTPELPMGFTNKISFGKVSFDDADSEIISFSDKKPVEYISFENEVMKNFYNKRFYDMGTSQMQFGKLCEIAMKVIKPNISWYDSLLSYLGEEINMFDSMLDSYITNKGQKTYQSSEVHRWVKPILDSATLSGKDSIENKASGNYLLYYDEEKDKENFEKELKIANIQYIYLQNIEKTKSTSLKMHCRGIDENDKGRKILTWRIVHAYPSDVMFGYLGLCRKTSSGVENVWIEMLVIDPNPHARNVEFSLERNGYLLGRSIAAVINEKLPREFREGFLYDEVENNIKERHEKYIENMKIIDEEVYKIERGIW